jgi:hypothetical protein
MTSAVVAKPVKALITKWQRTHANRLFAYADRSTLLQFVGERVDDSIQIVVDLIEERPHQCASVGMCTVSSVAHAA